MQKRQLAAAAAAVCASGFWVSAQATNGMNMEGYGPIATGMGGAATAYDNGTAAMANNPATLQLAPIGHRVDGAVGMLGPDVTAYGSASGGTSYVMPAIGWAKTDAHMTWGVGVFAQGGMGTEFGTNSAMVQGIVGAGGTNEIMRSELGVGRLIFPLSYRVNDRFTVGASLDYVWANLDLAMAAGVADLMPMVNMQKSTMLADPNVQQALGAATTGRIAFSDNNDFSGAAKSTGWGAKLGFTYSLDDVVTIGASYHAKTNLSDMKTGTRAASLNFTGDPAQADKGQVDVHNFQWPATTAIGMSWKASPKLTLAADLKHIAWSDVMKSLNMTYTSNTAFQGKTLVIGMPQNWRDQTVTMLGGAYQISEQTVLRAGVNVSSNPIPNETVNFLFPATVESHYTLGVGHQLNEQSAINASLTVAPKVSVTDANGGTITHSQTNFQLMYSYRY